MKRDKGGIPRVRGAGGGGVRGILARLPSPLYAYFISELENFRLPRNRGGNVGYLGLKGN